MEKQRKADSSSDGGVPGVTGFWQKALDVLPKLKAPLQIIGFIVLVGGFVAYRAVAVQYVPGVIAAGCIGILLIIFGQLFKLIESVPKLQHPAFLTIFFLVFCTLIVILFSIAVTSYMRNPSGDDYAKYVNNTHDSNMDKANRSIQRNPAEATQLQDAKQDLDREKDRLVDNILNGRQMPAKDSRERYNNILEKMKAIDPLFDPTKVGNVITPEMLEQGKRDSQNRM
jgi:hypothetical protein